MKWPMKSRVAYSALVALPVLADIAAWLPNSELAMRYAHRHPEWAWRHGSATMQKSAASILKGMIKPGTAMQTVVQLLGPGSADGPNSFNGNYTSPGEGMVSTFGLTALRD